MIMFPGLNSFISHRDSNNRLGMRLKSGLGFQTIGIGSQTVLDVHNSSSDMSAKSSWTHAIVQYTHEAILGPHIYLHCANKKVQSKLVVILPVLVVLLMQPLFLKCQYPCVFIPLSGPNRPHLNQSKSWHKPSAKSHSVKWLNVAHSGRSLAVFCSPRLDDTCIYNPRA